MTHVGLIVFCTLTAATPQPVTQLATEKAQNSYALGQDLAGSIKQLDADVDIDALLQGVRDSLEGKKALLSEAEIAKVRARAHGSILQNREKQHAESRAKNAKAGQDFAAKHKLEKGVVTTPSGLQYQVVTAAAGAKPTATSRVKFNYKATLVDGTELDSSFAHGQPAVLRVDQGIAGWKEAFPLMTVGSTYRFVIPPQLAYGAEGMPGKVPPDATLIYEITLLGLVP